MENKKDTKQSPLLAEEIRLKKHVVQVLEHADIGNKFALSVPELFFLTTAFTYYLHAKGSKPMDDHANFLKLIEAKVPGSFEDTPDEVHKSEFNKQLTKKLKEALDLSSFPSNPGRPTRAQLVNTANYLTSKFIENPFRFRKQVETQEKYINKLLGRT